MSRQSINCLDNLNGQFLHILGLLPSYAPHIKLFTFMHICCEKENVAIYALNPESFCVKKSGKFSLFLTLFMLWMYLYLCPMSKSVPWSIESSVLLKLIETTVCLPLGNQWTKTTKPLHFCLFKLYSFWKLLMNTKRNICTLRYQLIERSGYPVQSWNQLSLFLVGILPYSII